MQRAEEVEDRQYVINSRLQFNLSVLRLHDFLNRDGEDILAISRLIGPDMRRNYLSIVSIKN